MSDVGERNVVLSIAQAGDTGYLSASRQEEFLADCVLYDKYVADRAAAARKIYISVQEGYRGGKIGSFSGNDIYRAGAAYRECVLAAKTIRDAIRVCGDIVAPWAGSADRCGLDNYRYCLSSLGCVRFGISNALRSADRDGTLEIPSEGRLRKALVRIGRTVNSVLADFPFIYAKRHMPFLGVVFERLPDGGSRVVGGRDAAVVYEVLCSASRQPVCHDRVSFDLVRRFRSLGYVGRADYGSNIDAWTDTRGTHGNVARDPKERDVFGRYGVQGGRRAAGKLISGPDSETYAFLAAMRRGRERYWNRIASMEI